MLEIEEFELGERLYESVTSLVVRVQRRSDGAPLILKVLKPEQANIDEIRKLHWEYHVLRDLDRSRAVTRALQLSWHHDYLVLIEEDMGAESLDRLLRNHSFSFNALLEICLRLTSILDEIHQAGYIHKDINPSNVILHLPSGRMRLIDFALSSLAGVEKSDGLKPGKLEGTLPYISPEQTGRFSANIDFRSDLYALGGTFYELFTGRLPFQDQETFDLVHCHLNLTPSPPHEIRPELPLPLSGVIMKLLAKKPEERYQSAAGLKADLDECRRRMIKGAGWENFEIGACDDTGDLHPGRRFFGRKKELRTIREKWALAEQGSRQILWIHGLAGIGKTQIVQEVFRTHDFRSAFIAYGKYDQLQSGSPYWGLTQALNSLISRILIHEEHRLPFWREQLTHFLGEGVDHLTTLIPELRSLFDREGSLSDAPYQQTKYKLQVALLQFFSLIEQNQKDLVLILDDLQWADPASLEILELILQAQDFRHFFIIGLFRPEALIPGHPVQNILKRLSREEIDHDFLEIVPWGDSEISFWVTETFGEEKTGLSDISRFFREASGGIPLNLINILGKMKNNGDLYYSSVQHRWRIRPGALDVARIHADWAVVPFEDLPEERVEILKLAACLGGEFNTGAIFKASERSEEEVWNHLRAAVRDGLIYQARGQEDGGRTALGLNEVDSVFASFRFSHDRVQMWFLQGMDPEERMNYHLRLGLTLLAQGYDRKGGDELFLLARQMNRARDLIKDQTEKDRLAEVNLRASRQAKMAAAFEEAHVFCRTGIELIGAGAWSRNYGLALQLHSEGVETAFLTGGLESMEELARIVKSRARQKLDQVPVCMVLAQAKVNSGHLLEGIQTCLDMLAQLGQPMALRPNLFRILWDLKRTRFRLQGKTVQDFIKLPEMTDPVQAAVVRFLELSFWHAYKAAPELVIPLICRQVDFLFLHGRWDNFCLTLIVMGMLICNTSKDYEFGHACARIGLEMSRGVSDKSVRANAVFLFYSILDHYKNVLQQSLDPLAEAHQLGLAGGELVIASHAAVIRVFHGLMTGEDLTALSALARGYQETFGRIRQQMPYDMLGLFIQMISELTGRISDVQGATSASQDEVHLRERMETEDLTAVFLIYFKQLYLAFLFGDHQRALEQTLNAQPFISGAAGAPVVPLFFFFDSLVLLAVKEFWKPKQRRTFKRRIARNQRYLKQLARYSPKNYAHKYDLVEAERARAEGSMVKAATLFQKSAKQAEEQAFINEAAISWELAGRFHLEQGRRKEARVALENARLLYLKWGAWAKVRQLESKHPFLTPSMQQQGEAWRGDEAFQGTISRDWAQLDMAAVLRASQFISEEMDLEILCRKIMILAVAVAGAQKGLLVLVEDGQRIVQESVGFGQSVLMDQDSDDYPDRSLNLVLETGEPLFLAGEASSRDNPDPYIQKHRPGATACLPLIYNGMITGVIYLECRLNPGIFEPGQVQTLQLLSAQAAISLANAGLYQRIRVSEQKYRSLYENTLVGIFQLDARGRIQKVNPAYIRLLGFDRVKEFESHISVSSLLPFFQKDAFHRFWEILSTKGLVREYEAEWRRQDGQPLWVLISAQVIENSLSGEDHVEGTLMDITTRKEAEKAIQDYQRQLQSLSMRMSVAEEKERRRISGVLHDLIGQNLILAINRLRPEPGKHDPKTRDLKDLLQETLEDTRSLTRELSPPILYDLGLESALEWLAEEIGQKYGLRIEVSDDGREKPLASDVRALVFRSIRELLINVAKHAGCREARIILRREQGQLIVTVQDHGAGFQVGEPSNPELWSHKSFGLFSVRESLRGCNGAMVIDSSPERGTSVTITLPLESAENEL